MTEDIKSRILKSIEEIGDLLEQYSRQTSEIITSDIDDTLEEIVARRGEILALIGQKMSDIDIACAGCPEQERRQVNRMISSGHMSLGMSPQVKEIHKAASKIRSAYIAVMGKEKQAALRVDARVKELRAELESVTEDKKKVDLYSTNVRIGSKKGGSFDSSN